MSTSLTYHDVRTILALLDGWAVGRIHFRHGSLVVDAITARKEPAISVISSPAVGIFTHAVADHDLGTVDAPLRSTPVAMPSNARLVSVLAPNGQFVEYGQPLAVVEAAEDQ